jgi:hypothetical protein
MTETEWRACADSQPLLPFVRECGPVAERKAGR